MTFVVFCCRTLGLQDSHTVQKITGLKYSLQFEMKCVL